MEGIAYIPKDRAQLRAQLEQELGYAFKLTANFPESLEHYLVSLDISREIADQSGMGKILKGIAEAYSVWGRYEDALNTLEARLK